MSPQTEETSGTPSRPLSTWRRLGGLWKILVPALLALAPLRPAHAQISWLNFEDGEILNVSSAEGPAPGSPFLQMRQGTETSDQYGTMVIQRVRLQYPLSSHVVLGASTVHLSEALHQYRKLGMGDTDLSIKIHFPLTIAHRSQFRIGLRQSLSLPTGYEQERDGLALFTSGSNDYAAQILLQYINPRFSLYLNPGVLLPGGKGNNAYTGGLGLVFTAFHGFDMRGEYYTRYDVVTQQFQSEVYGGLRHRLLFGIAAQMGMKRRLLQSGKINPEFQLGFSLGHDRTPDAELYEAHAPKLPPTGLLLRPVESLLPDPDGVLAEIQRDFRNEGADRSDALLIFVQSEASEPLAPALKDRHYELRLRLLDIRDGENGGVQLGSILRADRSQTTLTAQAELIAPDGSSVVKRAVFQGRASHLQGITWAPNSGSLESTVTPDEEVRRLRHDAAVDLTRKVVRAALRAIQERDAQ